MVDYTVKNVTLVVWVVPVESTHWYVTEGTAAAYDAETAIAAFVPATELPMLFSVPAAHVAPGGRVIVAPPAATLTIWEPGARGCAEVVVGAGAAVDVLALAPTAYAMTPIAATAPSA
jgi:hypothetical protein